MLKINNEATTKQKSPERATVVNLGVSFLHLNVTEKIEKPMEDVIPNTKPNKDALLVLPKAMIIIPIVANTIAIHTFKLILSLKKRNPSRAVKKGIAAKHSNVIAAEVLVIEYIKLIIAIPKPMPPIKPDTPIFK